ncbi:Aste57867_14428 [Aphanomyces stellatus]|uniref:Aste57867_14428 protein n=1 Tax=Aphanomyces stellatus TaxID=120398 RepID=A0A485L0L0_9STRA|nr:hypothetical protein As57867_014374 [Aphanomyces stellatus]VFT91250.1 Aste57867_14428 [Aphanomyces stellatus]
MRYVGLSNRQKPVLATVDSPSLATIFWPLGGLPPQLAISSPPRRHSSSCGFFVARLLHLLISIYLVFWALIFDLITIVESHELHVENPRLSSIALMILALLHMWPSRLDIPLRPSRRLASTLVEFLDANQDMLNVLFNLYEVASQSVRVVELADNFVDASSLISYALCVIAYAAISP